MGAKEIFHKCTVVRLGVPLTRHGQYGHLHAMINTSLYQMIAKLLLMMTQILTSLNLSDSAVIVWLI